MNVKRCKRRHFANGWIHICPELGVVHKICTWICEMANYSSNCWKCCLARDWWVH